MSDRVSNYGRLNKQALMKCCLLPTIEFEYSPPDKKSQNQSLGSSLDPGFILYRVQKVSWLLSEWEGQCLILLHSSPKIKTDPDQNICQSEQVFHATTPTPSQVLLIRKQSCTDFFFFPPDLTTNERFEICIFWLNSKFSLQSVSHDMHQWVSKCPLVHWKKFKRVKVWAERNCPQNKSTY